MKKNRLNITALCMLLVFLVGSVGVNVSRTYCSHCDLYRWQVFFVSFEENGADVQLCGCCHKCAKRPMPTCPQATNEHAYYKIADYYSGSSFHFSFDDAFVLVTDRPFAGPDVLLTFNHLALSFACTDSPPSPERLCTFRC